MTRHQRFAAARRHAKTNVRHSRKAGHVPIGSFRRQHEGRFRIVLNDAAEIAAQRVKAPLLVVLQLHGQLTLIS
jgi:hypothetical protein